MVLARLWASSRKDQLFKYECRSRKIVDSGKIHSLVLDFGGILDNYFLIITSCGGISGSVLFQLRVEEATPPEQLSFACTLCLAEIFSTYQVRFLMALVQGCCGASYFLTPWLKSSSDCLQLRIWIQGKRVHVSDIQSITRCNIFRHK